jgi:cyclopropane-fatty-acyl-phospholipid synthase
MPNSPTSLNKTHSNNVTELERWLLKKMLQYMGKPPVSFKLWNGDLISAAEHRPENTILHLHTRKTLWRLLANPALNFGDDYSSGRITLEGDLTSFIEAVYASQTASRKQTLLERYIINRPRRMRRNTVSDAKRNIHHHYDLGNDFYRLWLDKEMQYTCAYFPKPTDTLETAQIAKMDHVCKKLRLKPGETVVEAGCGWGALALHMARHYGVHVRAYNISHEQIAFAKERAKREGLSSQVQYFEDDYRNISGEHDVFVSVGMMEHVGRTSFGDFGRVMDRSLKPEGRGLLHSISQNEPRPVNAWIERRIFPGGYTPTLREMLEILEPLDLVVNDVENLRLHYAKTLEHWLHRFNMHKRQITDMYDEHFLRAWRLYLCGSIANFQANALQLYQIVFTRAVPTDMPWTRAYLYKS